MIEPATLPARRDARSARDCTIGPLTTLIDTAVGDGVDASCTPTSTAPRVGDGVAVGPFAYLRPDAAPARRAPRPARSSRSRTPTIGAGTKVPHLSYIGDADIGEGTNIGAGNDHRQLRRRATSTARRSARGVRTSVDTAFVAPGDRRRRRLHRRRLA